MRESTSIFLESGLDLGAAHALVLRMKRMILVVACALCSLLHARAHDCHRLEVIPVQPNAMP